MGDRAILKDVIFSKKLHTPYPSVNKVLECKTEMNLCLKHFFHVCLIDVILLQSYFY